MSTPPRPVRVVKEPIGAKNQRKINFVPKDPELLTNKPLLVPGENGTLIPVNGILNKNTFKYPKPVPVDTPPFNWSQGVMPWLAGSTLTKRTGAKRPRNGTRKNKSKKSRRTRKN
jgi:hypothetical protein